DHLALGLQQRERAVAERLDPFVAPADGRAERDAELTDLALGAELLELVPQRVVADGIDARVVELVEVDALDAEAAQRTLELGAERLGAPVVRALALPGPLAVGLD